ncbi:MAG: MMPL family transporter, partial [Pseudomonadota bacterium]
METIRNPFLRFPRATILVCVVAFLAAASGILQFSLTYDTRVYFNPEGADFAALRNFEAKYGQDNSVLMVVSAPGRKMTEPETLAALADLVSRAWTLPHSSRVDGLTNFPHVVSDADSFSVADLVPGDAALDAAQAREIERIALDDMLIRNRLLSADAETAGVIVNFNLPAEASAEVREIVAAVRALAAAFEKDHPGMEVRLTGNVMLMAAFSEAAMIDVMYLIPTSLAVTGLVMLIFVRALLPSLAILSLLGLSSAAAMGIVGWYGYDLNTSTVSSPVVIMTVNMAAAVRLVTTALHALGRGISQREAIAEAVSANLWPITLTSATTIVGFLSMNLADAPPLRQQGNIVALGIVIAFIFTFTWLPAVLSLMKLKPTVQRSQTFMVSLGHFVNRYYRQLFILCSAIVIACAVWLGNIRLDDDFARYFDENFEFRQASDYAEDHLTGLNIVEFDIGSGEAGGVFEPAYQAKLAEFEAWLRTQPGVVSVAAISDITERVHDAMNPGAGTAYAIPADRETIAQYFLLYELSLPFGASLNDRIDVARSSSRVTVILRHMTSANIREFNENATAWLATNAPPEMQARATGI